MFGMSEEERRAAEAVADNTCEMMARCAFGGIMMGQSGVIPDTEEAMADAAARVVTEAMMGYLAEKAANLANMSGALDVQAHKDLMREAKRMLDDPDIPEAVKDMIRKIGPL